MKKLILITIMAAFTVTTKAQYTGLQVHNYIKANAVEPSTSTSYMWKELKVKLPGNKTMKDNSLWFTEPYRLDSTEYKLALDSTLVKTKATYKTMRQFRLAVYRNKRVVIEQRVKIIKPVIIEQSNDRKIRLLFQLDNQHNLPDTVFWEAGDRILGLWSDVAVSDTIQ